MAKNNSKKPTKARSKAAQSAATSSGAKTKKAPNVKVKNFAEIANTTERLLAFNLHDRYKFEYTDKTKKQLVAYGPWLATFFVVVLSPQLLNLSKNGSFITISGFFNNIFFNQKSWVILVIILLSVLLLVDGLNDIFSKKIRGWNRVYLASLMTLFYCLWQLITNLSHPAAPLLSVLGSLLIVFTILDIRNYYR